MPSTTSRKRAQNDRHHSLSIGPKTNILVVVANVKKKKTMRDWTGDAGRGKQKKSYVSQPGIPLSIVVGHEDIHAAVHQRALGHAVVTLRKLSD